MFGKKNAICITKFQNSINIHLYDFSTNSLLSQSISISANEFLPSFEWYIGGSPEQIDHPENLNGYLDYFVYFNEYLNSNTVEFLFKSFYATPLNGSYRKVNEFSRQSVSGLTADYASVNLSVFDEVDQYVQKKYLINRIGSLNVLTTGSVDALGDGDINVVITGNLIRNEEIEQNVTKYIKFTTEERLTSQTDIDLGTLTDESRNILKLTAKENNFENINIEQEVGENDDWDEERIVTEILNVQIEEDIFEEFDFQKSGLETFGDLGNVTYEITTNYTSNGGTLIDKEDLVVYTNPNIQENPITINKRTQEFFQIDPDATEINEDYVLEFGFDNISILQYVESGYELYTFPSEEISNVNKVANFSVFQSNFLINKPLTSEEMVVHKNGLYLVDKGKIETLDQFQNLTRTILGDFSIVNNVIDSGGFSKITDMVFYDNISTNSNFIEINDWSGYPNGVIDGLAVANRVFFMNGQRLEQGRDYEDFEGNFMPLNALLDILGTLVYIDNYIGEKTNIDRSQGLENRIKRNSAAIYLNGVRISPSDVVLHASVDKLSGNFIEQKNKEFLVNETSDRLDFWEQEI
jgi:hypothetical protein